MGFSENNTTFKAAFGEVYKVGGGGVNSVNGKTGAVVLTASDVGAYTTEETNTKLSSKADKSEIPTVPKKISELEDDTNDLNPIRYASYADRCSYADAVGEVPYANIAQFAEKDYKNNVIHETYATKAELGTIESVAKGRATGYVFDTVEDMNAWLENADNVSNLVLGDNLYIRATDVPDYWWDGSTAQPLETQKVDLTEYVKNTDYATADKAGVVKVLNSTNKARGVILASDNILQIAYANKADITAKKSYNQPITPIFIEHAVEVCTNQDINAELTEAQLKLPLSTQSVKDTIGDIDTALERIIAIQNGLMGVSE